MAGLALGMAGASLALAPAASAADANKITSTVSPASNLKLQKKNGSDWVDTGTAVANTASAEFSGLADGTYRVVAENASCTTKASAEVAVSGDETEAANVGNLVCDFVPLTPTRLLDTRATATGITHIDPHSTINPTGNTGKANGDQITKVKVENIPGVPDGVNAVSLNVTGVDSTTSDNFITVWDCADNPVGDPPVDVDEGLEPDPPLASNLNLATNDIRPNAVVAKAGPDDTVCIYTRRSVHLVVDITGYFPSQNGNAHINLAGSPTRVLETRLSQKQVNYQGGKPVTGQVIRVDLGAPADSYLLNVTAVDGNGGWITVWDCTDTNTEDNDAPQGWPDPPATSNLNAEAGVISANLVVTKGNGSGEVCFYTSQSAHVIADLLGSFPTGSSYTPNGPRRVLETRTGIAGSPQVNHTGGKPAPGAVIVLDLYKDPDGDGPLTAPLTAPVKAVALNVTGTQPTTDGFVSVYPCVDASTAKPNASNLNLVTGQSRPNLVLTGLTNGKVCLYTQNGTHLVADLFGSFPG